MLTLDSNRNTSPKCERGVRDGFPRWRVGLVLRELAFGYLRDAVSAAANSWNRFWFSPADSSMLCLIRVLAGLMLLYSHAVWTLHLEAFFGEHSWLTREVVAQASQGGFTWSVLSWCRTPAALWTMHVAALMTFALLTIGLWTRVVSVLAFVFTVSYAYRTPGALYGLDQVNGFLSLYLMIGPSGSRFSVDAVRARRAGRVTDRPSVTGHIAVRLIQCHLCVIYLFAGLSKLQGPTWWNGLAVWGGIANQEYQTLDLTWLADWPPLVNFLTHATVAWELSYCVLIWNRWTRPLVLLGAIGMHLGIITALGMPTFGLAMLIANVAFVSPAVVRIMFDPVAVPSLSVQSMVSGSPAAADVARRVDSPTADNAVARPPSRTQGRSKSKRSS